MNVSTVTARQATKIIKDILDREGLKYSKVSSKTVHFSDLLRRSCVFVYVDGWIIDQRGSLLLQAASDHKFVVQFRGPGIIG